MNAEMLRKRVARDIADNEIKYDDALKYLQLHHVFDNWADNEFYYRPVNIEELYDLVAEELYGPVRYGKPVF